MHIDLLAGLVIGILIGLGIYIFIATYIAAKMEYVAQLKGYGKEVKAFSMCFWFGLIGCIYVAALPDKRQQEQNSKIIRLLNDNN